MLKLMIGATLTVACSLPAAAYAQGVEVEGVLDQGTPLEVFYRAVAPENWNGTLVLDLDFNGWSEDRVGWFLENGFAVGGNQRTNNETAYAFADYVDHLLETRDLLVEGGADEPERIIVTGNSRGSFVARMAVQTHPDVFDGALASAGGGGGVLATWNQKTDAVWALKTLAAPDSTLAISDLPDFREGSGYGPGYEEDQALAELLSDLAGSEEGMARIVLAGALAQMTGWDEGPMPEETDYALRGEQVADAFAFAHPQFLIKTIEIMAGGPIAHNQGYDYGAALQASGDIEMVRWWYEEAGLDLNADLETLADAPRHAADPDAIATAEALTAYDGTGGPVLALKTLGDIVDSTALDAAYSELYASQGNESLLRTLYIERPGHSGQSELEWRLGFNLLVERLDSGEWPEMTPDTLAERASVLAETMPDVDDEAVAFVDFEPAAPLRTWDVRDFGSYQPQ